MIHKVIKMSASWCSPCKAYAKTFHEVSGMDDFKDIIFEEADVDEEDELVEKYNVRSVPTTVFLDENENVVSLKVGNLPKNTLETIIKEENK